MFSRVLGDGGGISGCDHDPRWEQSEIDSRGLLMNSHSTPYALWPLGVFVMVHSRDALITSIRNRVSLSRNGRMSLVLAKQWNNNSGYKESWRDMKRGPAVA